jgi:type IV pilus assembly protein PilA
MQGTLNRLRARTDDEGFTLIELLVVVMIIGVLVAIAVPVYLNYRQGAADESAQSDVRSAITAVEQYYTENSNTYPATQVGSASTNLTFGTQTATVSSGNTLSYKNNGTSYVICGSNSSGGTIYVYNSATGNPVGKSTQNSLAACVSNGN